MRTVATLALLTSAGVVSAGEIYEVWGHGATWEQARDDARTLGVQLCISQGYSGAAFEEVQTYDSGGGYITYGLAECY
ncbi:hypothetical protein MNO14_07525 [Luteimonas sp. S4-F44]|uniref:hypothetical protein n=1 Tax=Luteimonas sp. S4-F44 TaxID=2925842 RepID=UPI001F533F3F|nr:hypothetical protein [Luteimonas sp. S4-F44]UNK43888.1 hypothetical protein MNO14_07525 [Luteimonas sp. S4-F44]